MSEDGESLAAKEGSVAEKEERDVEDKLSEEEEGAAGMADDHKELARDMFEKITDYLNGELAGIVRQKLQTDFT